MFVSMGLLIVVALVVFLVYVARQPSDFKISREMRIKAPPAAIFPYLNDPRKMNEWNPWMKLDPQVRVSYSGPAEGVGAMTTWAGNKQVGVGSATIVESNPDVSVHTRLEYLKPFPSTSHCEMAIRTEGPESIVSWSNAGKAPFIMKLFCALFLNMDKMVGGIFERGLGDLKSQMENR